MLGSSDSSWVSCLLSMPSFLFPVRFFLSLSLSLPSPQPLISKRQYVITTCLIYYSKWAILMLEFKSSSSLVESWEKLCPPHQNLQGPLRFFIPMLMKTNDYGKL